MQCPEIIFAWLWAECLIPHPKPNVAASYSSTPSNMDKHFQKKPPQILISSRLLISWGPGEDTLGEWRGGAVTGGKRPGQALSECWHWSNSPSQKCCEAGCGSSCQEHPFPSCSELFPPVSSGAPLASVAGGVPWCSRSLLAGVLTTAGSAAPRGTHLQSPSPREGLWGFFGNEIQCSCAEMPNIPHFQ